MPLTIEAEELLAKWEAELRSGNHKQGHCRLVYIDQDDILRKCCLGVLGMCIQPLSEWTHQRAHSLDAKEEYLFDEESSEYVPHAVLAELGIRIDQDFYASANDERCFEFERIADMVHEREGITSVPSN